MTKRSAVIVGLCLTASIARGQTVLVKEGADLRYFKGTEQPEAAWNTVGFDDSTWETGKSPIGYSSDAIITFGTRLTDMQNSYMTLYTRTAFQVTDRSSIVALNLKAKFDDGFVAYLNGVQVHCQNMSTCDSVTKDTPATDHEETNTFMVIPLKCEATEALVNGDNVLAIELHNVNLGSSDCVISAELEVIASVCPQNLTTTYRETTNQVLVRWTKPSATFVYDALDLYRDNVKIENGPKPNVTSFVDRDITPGTHEYRLEATACGTSCPPLTSQVTAGGTNDPKFRRGDSDDNGQVQLTDAVFILNYLFRGGTAPNCPDSADVDDNGDVQLTDGVYVLNYLFRGGAPPPAPGADACDIDPAASADQLGACTYNSACQ